MAEENTPQKLPAQPAPGQQPYEIVIEVSKEEDFKRFYAIGAIGVNNIYDFRVSFYNDDPELGQRNGVKKIQRKIGTEVILSPVAAKELARWLTQNVKDYENKFGEIKSQSGQRGNSKGTADNDTTVLDGYA
ncbi:hypothetical protein MmiHf6_04340 [Methanimicrococcus hongohii]|uniref:DUF3467 domain-containing protein n=1 Tax=Methanimicrococcus hongohii TaxID=3028295 RepID=A0AA96V9V7_9EURY|nr:DUF3467 domain-containing protein [Methanimicrococcus sp. Hf6]WNY23132.1 hypothetical protein MmiHf6_04340 [Methanimicrococcus sp. Hf6]